MKTYDIAVYVADEWAGQSPYVETCRFYREGNPGPGVNIVTVDASSYRLACDIAVRDMLSAIANGAEGISIEYRLPWKPTKLPST